MQLRNLAARAIDALAIVTFTGMFLCVFVQVILRYGFDRPLVWSDELARYLDAGPARDAVAGRARPCDAYRPYDWALQHEPAE